jgi:hypothetical protein
MERVIEVIKSYESRVMEAFFEITRDPYMALMECSFIRLALGRDEYLSMTAKARINRQLRETESQADFDWVKRGYC